MSCTRTLEFCVNHTFLLDPKRPKSFDENFVFRLKAIKPQLENFLAYYTKYSDVSASAFKNSSNTSQVKDFILKLSQFLNLTCDVSFSIIQQYLLIDGKIQDNNLEKILTRGLDYDTLMKEVAKFYHQERLSLAKIVRYIFSDVKDEWKIIANIILHVSGHKDKLSLFNKILVHYEASINELSGVRPNPSYWEESSHNECILHSLEEQKALLETMLLGVYSMKNNRTKETFRDLFRVFKEISVLKDVYLNVTSTSTNNVTSMLDKIGLLQALVLVEAAGIDELLADDEKSKKHFLADNDILAQINTMTAKLGKKNYDGILMLFSSLVFTTFQPKAFIHINSAKIAEEAIVKRGVLKYLRSVLTSQPYSISPSHCAHLELVVHRVIFDLLSLMSHKIHINSLPKSVRTDLITVMCQLIRPINLYSDVKLLHSGFLKMMEDLSLSFPVNLDMLKMVSSLFGKSDREGQDEIVAILSEFLDHLSWFCDGRSIESNCIRVDDSDDNDDKCAKRCRLITQYLPYCTRKNVFVLDEDQEGFLMEENVLWAVSYSAWDVIAAEIEMTYQLLTNDIILDENYCNLGPSQLTSVADQLKRLETILDFLSACVTSNVNRDFAINMFFELWILVDSGHLMVDGCECTLVKLIDLAALILGLPCLDQNEVMRIVLAENVFPISHASLERTISNDSVVLKAWQNICSDPTNVAIVKAYLRFSMNLISAEKTLSGESGIIPPSLIYGCIVFTAENLLVELPQLTLANRADVTDLMSKSLMFINEILSLNPVMYTGLSNPRKQRLSLIRQATADIIHTSAPIVRALLSMSSIEVDFLIKHTNVSSQMLIIEGSDENLSHIVIMALSALRFLMSPPGQEEIIDKQSSVLSILNSPMSSSDKRDQGRGTFYVHRYVLSLLQLLGYPFGSKVARMALVVLRQVMVSTGVSVVASLGERAARVRDLLLSYIGSDDVDQLTRALVFEFMADCVMAGSHGIVQLVFGGQDASAGVHQSCVDVLSRYQVGDNLKMVLLVSVGKFLSALWINDCQSILVSLRNTNLWSSLLAPLPDCMTAISRGDALARPLYDYLGHVFGLFAMEMYSSGTASNSSEFQQAIGTLFSRQWLVSFLAAFDEAIVNSDGYLEGLVAPTARWKTLLFTVIGLDEGARRALLPAAEEVAIVTAVLAALPPLTAGVSVASSSLADCLASVVLDITHKQCRSMAPKDAEAILATIISLMSSLSPSPGSSKTHHYHADLITSCSLIIHSHSIDAALLRRVTEVTGMYIDTLTLAPLTSQMDSRTLVQSLTTYISVLNSYYGDNWVASLSDRGTLMNLLSLLHDLVRAGNLSEPVPSVLTLLTRVSATKLGSIRLLQYFLASTLDSDLPLNDDQSVLDFLSLVTQLLRTLLEHAGKAAHPIVFRFISSHWERLETIISTACHRLSTLTTPMATVEDHHLVERALEIGTAVCDLAWRLEPVRGLWPLHWSPATVAGLSHSLVHLAVNVAVSVLVADPAAVFVHARRAPRLARHSMSSPAAVAATEEPQCGPSLRTASADLEGALRRLLHSALSLYARMTGLASEQKIYAGWEHAGDILVCDFEAHSRTKAIGGPLSFGTLFSLLTGTQTTLQDQSASPQDRDLLQQTHEIAISIIVSQAVTLLAHVFRQPVHAGHKTNFLLNMQSELQCYLDGLSKSRRRSTVSASNSPLNGGPRLTSTPCSAMTSRAGGEGLDRLCSAVDTFRKALDSF